ncbi:hypothetical protein [Cryobacterium sp. TMS1-13-1]|uniref:hypothetical protein n=1 Tax=Cryobacterium sp. TMS1-13-1 TaxID=1259220 RepID=UPI0010694D5F|nr:hypothetical protein [Cryobacterium sp. TMS1-13-1]TFD21534.1 hypothetical protein E3T31_12165 [Cryobacterium sp. TMS1-13-1]
MFFSRTQSQPPKVQGQTQGRTLVVRFTKAQYKALFDMWYLKRDDRALSEVWSKMNLANYDAREHEFSAWGIASRNELKDTTACMTCGLAWRLHDWPRPASAIEGQETAYAMVFNLSETQYATLSEVLKRAVSDAPGALEEAWRITSRAHSAAPVHLYGTNEVDSQADFKFQAQITCIVCGLSWSRHTH